MTRTVHVKMPDTLTQAQKRRVVDQMMGITHFEGCWASGPMHNDCAVAHIERLEAEQSASGMVIAERDATIANLGSRLAVAETDYLRRHREPAERYERIAQLEAHNLERHQVRIKRITRLRLLQARAHAAQAPDADAARFQGLTTAVLAEIDALLAE